MRSLFVTRWRPHDPDGGAPLRNAQNIAALQALGQVDVLSVGRPEAEGEVPGIGRWRHFEARPRLPGGGVLAPGYHPLVDSYRLPEAEATLDRMLAENGYDLAVVEEISMARYLPRIRAAGVTAVFDAHNVEAALRADVARGGQPSLRALLRRRLLDRRIGRIECAAVRHANLVWACSAGDAEALRRLYGPRGPVDVVPNTVDTSAYVGLRAEQTAGQVAGQGAGAPMSLLYTGTFSYRPNEEAAIELIGRILPELRRGGETVRLLLVGRLPTEAMRRAAASDPDVLITGAVPSVLPYFANPCIVVLPIRSGSGTRLKILEAFAAGAAVVSTAKGAEGIAVTDGRDISLAETPAEFAAAIRTLWRDPAARAAQVARALALVEARYSWQAAARAIRGSLAGAGLL